MQGDCKGLAGRMWRCPRHRRMGLVRSPEKMIFQLKWPSAYGMLYTETAFNNDIGYLGCVTVKTNWNEWYATYRQSPSQLECTVNFYCAMRSLKRFVALLPCCSSGTGVHCDHMVHVCADLSSWLDSALFWTLWHQSTSVTLNYRFTKIDSVYVKWKKAYKMSILLKELNANVNPLCTSSTLYIINIIRTARYLCGSWASCSAL